VFSFRFRADYIDTDAMGIVHHASYLRFFERVRVEWLRSIGMNYRKMEEDGMYLPLHSCQLNYKLPMHFDDEFDVILTLGALEKASLTLDYKVICDETLRATGTTTHVLCQRKTIENKTVFSIKRIPSEWRTVWQQPNEKKL